MLSGDLFWVLRAGGGSCPPRTPPCVNLRGQAPSNSPHVIGSEIIFFFSEFFCSGKAKLDPETMKFGFSVKKKVYTLAGKHIARRNDQF